MVGSPPKPCLTCGALVTGRNRCIGCQALYEAERETVNPARRAYRDLVYRSFVPSGDCFWGCGRPATTRDHLVPLSENGTNDPSNLVGACATCNYGRKGRDLRS